MMKFREFIECNIDSLARVDLEVILLELSDTLEDMQDQIEKNTARINENE
jgi:hypothetical protein